MSEIYQEKLEVNLPEFMDKSAKAKSLKEALDTVLEGPGLQVPDKLSELASIAVNEGLDGYWLKLIEERTHSG